MSKTIDERVVEMRFDNKQFESNVQTSLSTIEKLKRVWIWMELQRVLKALTVLLRKSICRGSVLRLKQ